MKQMFLFILLAVGAICGRAEQYDEAKLLGAWEITEKTGTCVWFQLAEEYLDNAPVKYISFGDIGSTEADVEGVAGGLWSNAPTKDYPDICSQDFFISNGDKLHIIFEEWSDVSAMRFVIDSFTDSELKLHTYDNKMSLTLKRIGTPNAVNAVAGEASIHEDIYSLNGVKVSNPQNGIYVVKSGAETTKKVIR